MNRHQLLACASAEMQTALKTYTHDDLPRTVTDTAAIDVLSALREGLRITMIQQLDTLPVGALIRSDGRNYEKRPDANWCWYEPGYTKPFPHHLRATLLDAHLLFHPTWATKGHEMSKHAKPTLVHIWTSDTENPVNLLVDDWSECDWKAKFTIPQDIGKPIFDVVHKQTVRAIVLGSEEVEWHINLMRGSTFGGLYEVECISRREVVRRSTPNDEWFLLHYKEVGLQLANEELVR